MENFEFPPPLIHSFFLYRRNIKHRKVSLPSFSVLWGNNISTQKRGTPLPFIHQTFRYSNLSETQNRSSTVFLRYCQEKTFRRKKLITYPLLSMKFFGDPKIFEHWWFPARYFLGTVRQEKIFDGKSDTPLLSMKFFETTNFLKHRRVPLRRFSVLWGKKLFEALKVCRTIFIGTVRQNFFIGPREIALVSIIFFDTRTFLEHRRVPLGSL